MRLFDLIDNCQDFGHSDRDIVGLTADSRQVKPGYLFAALPGHKADGRNFIADAVGRGATAILVAPTPGIAERAYPAAVIEDFNPRRRLALMAARFAGKQPAVTVAVTGTNGKTSVVEACRQIWQQLGHNAASMGTLGCIHDDQSDGPSLTTPDPVTLHQDLYKLATNGVDHLAIEASSHGLDQSRLDGLHLKAAGFTNLSRDHLDYHGDMSGYLSAKMRLFTDILSRDGVAVLNRDSQHFEALADIAAERRQTVLSFGQHAESDLRLVAATPQPTGQLLDLCLLGKRYQIELPLIGTFQAFNSLAAMALVIAAGGSVAASSTALASLRGAPGRLQLVAQASTGGAILVDYAHTPDALATVLTALRPHVRGNLSVIFGCGGDRDPGKRPLMGAAAHDHADVVWLTDDNPRSEVPADIRAAARSGCPNATEIADRGAAIAAAISALAGHDVLVITGKGHEQGQIIGDQVIPFDDATVARQAALSLGGKVIGVAA